MKQREGSRARRGERGSAMLIVFVFAAVLLIMLYREIPIATFEAQRQKEQLLIDRGHEYQRAVQLFYRKFNRQYPSSIDQLMSTNSMRFLRRKYKDPLTGKDDWRLLHAGPGGMLIDSKVNPIGMNQNGGTLNNGQNGQNNQAGQVGQIGQTNQAGQGQVSAVAGGFPGASAFDSNSDGSGEQTGLDGQTAAKRHSAPAITTGGGAATASPDAGALGSTPTTAELNADPSKPLLPTTADAGVPGGGQNTTGSTSGAPAGVGPGGATTPGTGQGQAAMNAVTGNSSVPTSLSQASSGGAISTGGVAGVASIAKGRSIKKVNEQVDYSKWEFYYDPSKDLGVSGANGTQSNQPAPATALTNSLSNSNSNNASSNSSSFFGNSTQSGNTSQTQPGQTQPGQNQLGQNQPTQTQTPQTQ